MLVQSISGVCQRRITLNWRVAPDVAAKVLPKMYRPLVINESCIVGIDVLKLVEMRPLGFPSLISFSMQNATPRIAVEWDEGGGRVTGSYVPFRWSAAQLNALMSQARLFPAKFKHAYFQMDENNGHFRVSVVAGKYELHLDATETDDAKSTSILGSAAAVSEFHRDAKISYTPAAQDGTYDGLYLKTRVWRTKPLEVDDIAFNYIEAAFPGAEFDSALVMRNVNHEWHYVGSMHDLSRDFVKPEAKKDDKDAKDGKKDSKTRKPDAFKESSQTI